VIAGMPGCRAYNCALGDETGTLEMHRSDYSQSSSVLLMTELHRMAFPESASDRPVRVEVRRLDDLVATLAIESEILLKIDVQGYEDRVLEGARALVPRVRAAIVEVSFQSLYQGQPLFADIHDRLHTAGLRYMGNLYQLSNPRDGAILQADALFVRL
jgi:FkbM family methyltransferase